MRIAILTTDPGHPVVPHLRRWRDDTVREGHAVTLHHDKRELGEGELLFLVSCGQILGPAERARFARTLVLHASDLPQGRGWSPHVWAVLRGESRITVCAIEAADPVDSGAIALKTGFTLEGHELLPEINARLFAAELDLMSQAVRGFATLAPRPQQGMAGAPLPRRTPQDSRLDPHKTLAEQFDLLRVADNERYPAFFELRGRRYRLKIDKVEE